MLAPLLSPLPPWSASRQASGTIVIPPPVFAGEPEPLFGYPVWSDAPIASVYGGSFRSTLPVTNLRSQEPGAFARTTSVDLASTKVRYNLGRTRRVRAIVIPKSTCTVNASYRITAGATDSDLNGAGVYRSEWLPTWPLYLDPERAQNFAVPTIHLLPSYVDAPNWQIEWRDTGNPAGFLDIWCPLISDAYSPAHAMSVGASLKLVDNSDIVTTDGNTQITFPRPKARTWAFSIAMQSESDAFLEMWQMLCDLGATQRFFFMFDRNDELRVAVQRSFLANMRDLTGVEFPQATYLTTGHVVSEVIL